MKTRHDLLQYAESVHRAIHGSDIQSEFKTDHPYSGVDINLLKELVDSTLVKAQVKEFEKDLKAEIDGLYSNLSIGTPVKVTKGSKDKRGLEGFIIHAQQAMQGSGKALFVYDVLTNNKTMVRDSATKPRLPKPGERFILRETYKSCRDQSESFKRGVQVELKADTTRKGHCITDALLDPNFNGSGFFSVVVQWNDHQTPHQSTYILTELNII